MSAAVVWLKLAHVAAIAFWAAALVALPLLLARAEALRGSELHRLHRTARFLYIGIASPAALAAVASGIGLMALGGVFAPWLAGKLLMVAGLAGLHILAARQIVAAFGERTPHRRGTLALGSGAAAGLALLTLALALGKPALRAEPPEILRPGGLGALAAQAPAPSPVSSRSAMARP